MKTLKQHFELLFFISIVCLVLFNVFVMKDNLIAAFSSLFGILYTILAGKGKIICYCFGLMGSGLYGYLSFKNAFWGNLALYICYYIPMQILGIFNWKKNLNKEKTIIKENLTNKERVKLFFICLFGSLISILILSYLKDKSPICDGIAAFLSIVGMYLTVKRKIEQWIIWAIVNLISLIMWLLVLLNGEKVYSTILMWGVYLFLAFYFYFQWKKEIK